MWNCEIRYSLSLSELCRTEVVWRQAVSFDSSNWTCLLVSLLVEHVVSFDAWKFADIKNNKKKKINICRLLVREHKSLETVKKNSQCFLQPWGFWDMTFDLARTKAQVRFWLFSLSSVWLVSCTFPSVVGWIVCMNHPICFIVEKKIFFHSHWRTLNHLIRESVAGLPRTMIVRCVTGMSTCAFISISCFQLESPTTLGKWNFISTKDHWIAIVVEYWFRCTFYIVDWLSSGGSLVVQNLQNEWERSKQIQNKLVACTRFYTSKQHFLSLAIVL